MSIVCYVIGKLLGMVSFQTEKGPNKIFFRVYINNKNIFFANNLFTRVQVLSYSDFVYLRVLQCMYTEFLFRKSTEKTGFDSRCNSSFYIHALIKVYFLQVANG